MDKAQHPGPVKLGQGCPLAMQAEIQAGIQTIGQGPALIRAPVHDPQFWRTHPLVIRVRRRTQQMETIRPAPEEQADQQGMGRG